MPGADPVPRLPQYLLDRARLLADREAILPLLPKQKVIVEVGVALGDFSDLFVRICEPRRFIAIDLFKLHEMPELWGRPTREVFHGGTHGAYYRTRFHHLIEDGKMVVMEGGSETLLATLDEQSIDIAYIDAEHSFDSVKRDLAVIRTKIKDDGYIILNDYIMNDVEASNAAYGVIHAANEFMIAENWEMIYFAFHSYMYCDVVLRKAGAAPPAEATVSDQIRARNADLVRELELMRASTSWRITAPIQALRRSLSRGAGK